MSAKANYFKLGLFVIAAIVAGVAVLLIIGSGRWLQPRFIIETYFNESVQGLDIGSQVKYRGVVIGQVTRITFTYVEYQLDKPISQRDRYVLVQAQVQPRLIGGRAAGDITRSENLALEVERGLRIRLAPQGITGTNYLEMDYVEPIPPALHIDWEPNNAYIPSAPSTVTQFVNAASEIVDRLHKLDIEGTVANLNKLLGTVNQRVADVDTGKLAQRVERTLERAERTFDQINRTIAGLDTRRMSNDTTALITELRSTNEELKRTLGNPALRRIPEDAAAAMARVNKLLDDPNLTRTLASMSRTLGRLDRILGGGEADLTTTIDNLRQITDNLRDLTEDARRYPANVLLGRPPAPPERGK